MSRDENGLIQWPKGVGRKGLTTEFVAAYRDAFDADPNATFCIGEIDGLTLVVATGAVGTAIQGYMRRAHSAKIQTKLGPTSTTADLGSAPASSPKEAS